MEKQEIYYFIDEAGHINNNQKVFIYGCLRTDTPNINDRVINELKNELRDSLYFYDYQVEIDRGFHACENHFDIRTHFYKILPNLNYRVFFEVIYKNSSYFDELKKQMKDHEIIEKMLDNLIKRMLRKNPHATHKFFIEELDVQHKSLNKIINTIKTNYISKFDLELSIVSKGENNLSIIDYINHNLFNIFVLDESSLKKNLRTSQTFNIIKDKFALIHLWNNDFYYSRKGKYGKTIEIDNLRETIKGDIG